MLTRDNITEIYRRYRKAPHSIDELDIAALFDETAIRHDILIDPETKTITFGSIDPESPFHTLMLEHIHAILRFDEWTAVVLRAAIVFLHRATPRVAVEALGVSTTKTIIR